MPSIASVLKVRDYKANLVDSSLDNTGVTSFNGNFSSTYSHVDIFSNLGDVMRNFDEQFKVDNTKLFSNNDILKRLIVAESKSFLVSSKGNILFGFFR